MRNLPQRPPSTWTGGATRLLLLLSVGLGCSQPLEALDCHESALRDAIKQGIVGPVTAGSEWNPTNSMNVARTKHRATLLPTTTSLTMPRDAHMAALLPSGKILVTGGVGLTPNSNTAVHLKSTEVYDPNTDTWSLTTKPLPKARDKHTATLLPSGKVLIAGGETDITESAQRTRLDSTEVYDPDDQTWSTQDVLGTARFWHTAILFPSQKLLVMGGNSTSDELNATDSSEVYDATLPPESHYGWGGCTTTPALPASGVWLGGLLLHWIAAGRARRAARVRE